MEAEDLTFRLHQLAEDVGAYKPRDPCPWPIGQSFNALLAQAKELKADDPVLAEYESVEGNGKYVTTANCGAIKTMAMQVKAAF